MKRLISYLFLIILVFSPIKVYALEQQNEEVEELYNYMTNIKSEYELLNDMDVRDYVKSFMRTGDGKFSFKKLYKGLITYAFKEVAVSMKLMGNVIIISIVCALLNNLQKAFSNESLSNIAYFVCFSLIIIIIGKSFFTGIELAKETINKMTDFMVALIPVLMMLLVSIGGFSEATLMDPIIIGAINVNARLYVDMIIPIIMMTFVLQFANNISEEYKIDKLTNLLNKITLWGQGIIMTVFVGIITVRGITSKTVDEVAVKTAKYAVDNFVPIVGGCLSDAISTVASYSLLLKNALSSVGLIIIIVIVIFPIIKLLIMTLMYKLTAALIEPISDSRLVNCISSVGDSLILITSCLISISVMFFIMISIIAATGRMAMV